MTREEAIARIENHKILHKMNESRAIYISEALDMAIKALEQETVSKESYDHEYFLRKELEMKIARLEQQEPVIEKIRAEIEQITDTMGVSYNQYVSKIDVLHILDKYKA